RGVGTVHDSNSFPLNRFAWVRTGCRTVKKDYSMRKQLLVSTAALLAGFAIASAQDMPGGKSGGQSGGGAQMERGSAGADRDQGRSGQAQRGAQDQSKQGQSQQRSQGQQRDQTTGQAPQRQQGQQGQSGQQGQTTGQAPQRQQGQQGQAPQQGQTQQQAPQQGQTQQGQTQQQPPQQGQAQQGQAQQGQVQGQAGGNVNLTAQQRTQIQQTVLASSNVPRVNNVNFAVSVGTVVPTSVRV